MTVFRVKFELYLYGTPPWEKLDPPCKKLDPPCEMFDPPECWHMVLITLENGCKSRLRVLNFRKMCLKNFLGVIFFSSTPPCVCPKNLDPP